MNRVPGLLLMLILLLPAVAAAQVPREPEPPPKNRVPGGVTLPQGMLPGQPAAAAPVVPDTARAELAWQSGEPAVAAVYVVPDTVVFGDIVGLVIEYPIGGETPDPALEPPADWIEYVLEVSGEHLDLLEKLVAERERPGGRNTTIVPVRFYRADPFVLAAGGVESPVIHVRGRTTDLAETAAIRAPRLRGWNLLAIAALALSTVLAVLLAWVLWRRRVAPTRLEQWEPTAPGWLAAARQLHALLESGQLDRGEGREHLDRLAAIARGYAAERYGIAAREMTGREIVAACRDRGFPLDPARVLGRLVDEADRRRYDPDPVTEAWVRERTIELVRCIEKLRILPRQTAVAAAEGLEADGAWAKLQQRIDQWQAAARHRPGEGV